DRDLDQAVAQLCQVLDQSHPVGFGGVHHSLVGRVSAEGSGSARRGVLRRGRAGGRVGGALGPGSTSTGPPAPSTSRAGLVERGTVSCSASSNAPLISFWNPVERRRSSLIALPT